MASITIYCSNWHYIHVPHLFGDAWQGSQLHCLMIHPEPRAIMVFGVVLYLNLGNMQLSFKKESSITVSLTLRKDLTAATES